MAIIDEWLYTSAERYDICKQIVEEISTLTSTGPSQTQPGCGTRAEPKRSPILLYQTELNGGLPRKQAAEQGVGGRVEQRGNRILSIGTGPSKWHGMECDKVPNNPVPKQAGIPVMCSYGGIFIGYPDGWGGACTPPLPTGVMPQPPGGQDGVGGGVEHRCNHILSSQDKQEKVKANSSAKMCHTLVDKVVSEAVRLANKEQRKRITICRGIVAALVNGAVSKSERVVRARTGFCRTMVRIAVNKAVAISETKSAPSKKRKLEVVEGVKNEIENQTSSKKARRMEVSVARGVMELSLENKARYRPKTGVTNKSEPEIVNNGSFNNISSNSNSKKVANKEKNGPHIQRGKFKAGGKRCLGQFQKNLITQYFKLDINLGGGETADSGGGGVGGKQVAGKTGGGDQHKWD